MKCLLLKIDILLTGVVYYVSTINRNLINGIRRKFTELIFGQF